MDNDNFGKIDSKKYSYGMRKVLMENDKIFKEFKIDIISTDQIQNIVNKDTSRNKYLEDRLLMTENKLMLQESEIIKSDMRIKQLENNLLDMERKFSFVLET
jgi:hypothetical protein